jgi:membrane protein
MLGRIMRRSWDTLQAVWQGWRKHDGTLLSAATAYYATFSLFPLCLVLMAMLGIVSQHSVYLQDQQKVLLDMARNNISPWLAAQMDSILAEVQVRASLGGPMGLCLLLLSAIGIFMQLQNIFNRIWEIPEPEPKGWLHVLRLVLWDRVLAFLMLLAIGLLLMGIFLSDIVLASVRSLVDELPNGRPTWDILQPLISIACDGILLGTIYKVLPKMPVRWIHALSGGLLGALVWALGKYFLLSLFVGEKFSAYGVLGAFIGLMFWFYYASSVVFLGAEFVRAIGREK